MQIFFLVFFFISLQFETFLMIHVVHLGLSEPVPTLSCKGVIVMNEQSFTSQQVDAD